MASFRVTIECENDAFVDREGREVSQILRGIATTIEEQMPKDGLERTVKDHSGNTVGFWDYV